MKRRVCATFILGILVIATLGTKTALAVQTIDFASGAVTPPPGGSIVDPNVEVSLDGGFTWTNAYTTDSGPWGPPPVAGARWVSPIADPFAGFGDPQQIHYRITVALPGGFAGLPTLSGLFAADDQDVSVSLNGTLIASYPYQGYIGDPNAHPFGTSNSSLFVGGPNVVEFVGLNLGGATSVNFRGTISPLLPTTADQCRNGGWQAFLLFRNQGDCVSFVATNGRNQPRG